MLTPAVAQAQSIDNMYPTGNYYPTCYDGSLSQGHFCQTDNADLTVYLQGSLSSSAKSTIKSSLSSYYSPTDLAVSVKSSGVYTGSSETDIIYQSGTLSDSYIGMTWCDDAVTSIKCDQHYIRFNKHFSINKSDACHETGHAVGLTHGNNASPRVDPNNTIVGCMTEIDTYYLGANNRAEINATY
ncbi:hypothetical protein [Streptomyces sp. TLI_171]|uniref:hypothetical protein n=1 Tax=Streptomyces sp. TLI_171 TaxID=1938859 RepID=UPI000C4F8E06|nr:hypothetical protein [Streptomyces sp. TLI_171]RKE23543.1 hypothetical protein BX266_7017 [Streptomyces sp. TLI_171]